MKRILNSYIAKLLNGYSNHSAMQPFKQLSSQRGVTVVELLLYMATLTILLSILTAIFVSALDVQSESSATSSVEQDGNYVLAKLAYDIHRAQSISMPVANGEVSDSLEIVIDGVNYLYSVDENNNLILADSLGENNLNNYGSSVSGFSVQRLGNVGGIEDTSRISFTLTGRIERISGVESKNFQTNLSLRRQ